MSNDDFKAKDQPDFDDEFNNSPSKDEDLTRSESEVDDKLPNNDEDKSPSNDQPASLKTKDHKSDFSHQKDHDTNTDSHQSHQDQFEADDRQSDANIEEDLPTKSQTEIELERVESIENIALPASQSGAKDSTESSLADEIESALAGEAPEETTNSTTKDKSSTSSLKAGELPVAHPEDNKKKVSLEDIIKNQKTEKQANKKPLIWIILTVVLLIAAVGIGLLYYLSMNSSSRQQAKLQSTLDEQKVSLAKLQKDLQAAKASQAESVDAADSGASFNSISEWAVKYPQDQTTADLTYSYSLYTVGQTEVERLSFSTTEISAIKENSGQSVAYPCDSTKAPVGWIERLSAEEFEAVKQSVAGTPMAADYDNLEVTEADGYVYMTGTPQKACSEQLNQTNYADKLKVVESLPKKFVSLKQLVTFFVIPRCRERQLGPGGSIVTACLVKTGRFDYD